MLKAILAISLLLGSFIIPVEAKTTSEFGHKLHPEKLLENTIGNLQIYVISNEIMVPKTIDNLRIISSNTEIIQILEIEDTSSFTKNVKIKAGKPGIATVALAASGFVSKEITLEVFNNNNHPTQLMIKITPNEFSIDGPKYGYVTVALATSGGLPTLAQEDTIIKIDTPNTDVIKLKDSEITINKGEYFGLTKFDIVGEGDAIIFAETENMNKISGTVKILEPEGPLEIRLSIIPKTFNSYSGATGFAIVQLVDASGIPVLAQKDIEIKLHADNKDISKNTSTDFEEVLFDKNKITIKKGEYSAFTKFKPRPNLGDFTVDPMQTFQMFVSVEDYLARGDTFTVLHDQIGSLEGEGPSITQLLPILNTGKKEIIGVTYFETEIEVSRQTGSSVQGTTQRELVSVTVPVMAKSDYELGVSSSESNSVKPINPIMKKGDNAVLIFADTGTIAPDGDLEIYVTDNDGVETITNVPNGPIEENINLQIEQLVPIILSEKEFPMLGYLLESAEEVEGEESESSSTTEEEEVDPRLGPTQFVQSGILTFSANDLVNVEPIKVEKNQEYVLSYQTMKDVGTTQLEGQIGKFIGMAQISSHTTDPTSLHIGYIDNMLVKDTNIITVQLLDSADNPVYAKKDTVIELISNDESVIKIPEQITIKEGEYFKTIEVETISEGIAEIAILSQDMPLSRYDITVVDISPILTLDLLGTMNWNERIEAKLSIAIPQIEASLDGFQVEWITDGGEVVSSEETTDSNGIAILNIIANEKDKVSISAKVSGNGLSESTLSKTAEILNMPIIEETEQVAETNSDSMIGIELDSMTMMFIIIPIAIGGTLFFLKRTDRLELITEKIPIMDKFEEIKERISDIRNR